MFLAEEDKRRQIFQENLVYIRGWNKEFARGKKDFNLRVNCFADRRIPGSEPAPAPPAPKAPDTFPDFETWKSNCSKVYANKGESCLTKGVS